MLSTIFWRGLTLIALLLGLIGAFLPVVPTVPFVLLAAAAASRGWPAFEAWLLKHPRYGPAIRLWRERGAVPRSAKIVATLMMAGSTVLIAFSPLPWAAKIAIPLAMFAVAVWLWLRPEE
ncbi:hypothetical protein SAMN04488120_105145 [Fontimonas thermophila]|uniref:Inner membrane protein n=1 Tax=Fontimonas thermophila TaxID=1076937 RepID=A0A1I2J251_9GAMM|nr:YbaN family protein [Fontimonas thermophila]SFF48539.1 hypothetical protein SAMN04488120_105145 [Fontimonas thermophila]